MAQELLDFCVEKGMLLDKSVLNLLSGMENQEFAKKLIEVIEFKYKQKIITKSFFLSNPARVRELLNSYDSEMRKILDSFFINLGVNLDILELSGISTREFSKEELVEKETSEENVNLLKIYQNPAKKIEVGDFVNSFRNRYGVIKSILQKRTELENLTSINRIDEGKSFSIIGMIYDKKTTKNDNVLLEVEDLTGKITALVNKNRLEVYEKSKEVILDEIVGLKCSGSREMVFVNDIIFPDARIFEKKKSKIEEIAAFTSDTHVGSNKFLEKNFLKFIDWLNGKVGDEKQKAEAMKVRYLFITGDTVDGVGVYPGQDKELSIQDVNKQYEKLTELLLMIRSDIKIILCPGQHDAVRVAEPQPLIGEFYGTMIRDIPNLYLVTNPALVEIGSGRDSGNKFKILMYHGASMHGIINSIDKLRLNKAHDHPTEVVKYMLKKRHLAPSHSLTTYTPYSEDPLLITDIPDIFATGDLHRPEVGDYNGVLLIASSCWQSITPFEEKVGNSPDPCKVPIFNLKTREIKMLDFSDACDEDESDEIFEGESKNGVKPCEKIVEATGESKLEVKNAN
ncbi:MAG: metallophosphoesterase [Candidatus Pacearchaeota archaeon]|jgi:DNA polymerase II small subunit